MNKTIRTGILMVFGYIALLAVLVYAVRTSPRPAGDRYPVSLTWDEYVKKHPYYRDLNPACPHPGWPGSYHCACGAGKCG